MTTRKDLRRELREWADWAHKRGVSDDDIADALVTLAADGMVKLYGRKVTVSSLRDFADKIERGEEMPSVSRH